MPNSSSGFVRFVVSLQNGDVLPYIVCSDKTLRGLCRQRPATREELLEVSGIGERKADEFGEAFLKAISEFEDEHRG